jgi:hypothetical protein
MEGEKGQTIIVPITEHRIEIAATPVDGSRYNAVVRIRRTVSEEKPLVETVTCLKMDAELAEQAGEPRAKRWIEFARCGGALKPDIHA